MFKDIAELFSRLNIALSKKAYLKVKRTRPQAKDLRKKVFAVIFSIWFALGISWFLVTNVNAIITTITSVFSHKSYQYNSSPVYSMVMILFSMLALLMCWTILHSKYSIIQKWKIQGLLLRFTEEADLLRQHDSTVNLTKSVKWIYWICNDLIYVELKAGGHVDAEKEKDIGRRLLGYFKKETHEYWELEDRRVSDGVIKMTFSHNPDYRFVVCDLDTLKKSELLHVPLTHKLSWTTRQPMGLVVGPTGSGKTSLLKSLIISFLANNPTQNQVFTIDGKGSFLSTAMNKIGEVATDGQSALTMVSALNDIMKKRYIQTNEIDDEDDVTHEEKFHDGNILLVADELLALVAVLQAQDKLLKPNERLYPHFYANLLSLIVKGRQASIFVILSGQQMPATILPTEARDSLGLRIALGRVSQQQAQEIFGLGLKDLPRVDTSDYGGLIWLDGLDWEAPKAFLSPYYDDINLPFKATLTKIKGMQGGRLR